MARINYVVFPYSPPFLQEDERLALGQLFSTYGSKYSVHCFVHGFVDETCLEGNKRDVRLLIKPPTSSKLKSSSSKKDILGYVWAFFACASALSFAILCSSREFASLLVRVAVAILASIILSLISYLSAKYRYTKWVDSLIKEYNQYLNDVGDYKYEPKQRWRMIGNM